MISNEMRWLLGGLFILALWPVQVRAQHGSWERHLHAGGVAYDYAGAGKQFDAGLEGAEAFGTQDSGYAISRNSLAGLNRARVVVPDDNIFTAASLVQYRFLASTLDVQFIGNTLYADVIHHENWEFGPMAVYRLGRRNVDDSDIDTMNDPDDALELGLFLGYAKEFHNNSRHRMNIHLNVTEYSGRFFGGISVLFSW